MPVLSVPGSRAMMLWKQPLSTWSWVLTPTAADSTRLVTRLHVAEGDRRLASPVSHVDPGDPPTFLTHGGQDQISPPEQSVLLANRLEVAGVPHRLIKLPWARHGFDGAWGGWDAQIVRHELAEFLEQRLAD